MNHCSFLAASAGAATCSCTQTQISADKFNQWNTEEKRRWDLLSRLSSSVDKSSWFALFPDFFWIRHFFLLFWRHSSSLSVISCLIFVVNMFCDFFVFFFDFLLSLAAQPPPPPVSQGLSISRFAPLLSWLFFFHIFRNIALPEYFFDVVCAVWVSWLCLAVCLNIFEKETKGRKGKGDST